MQSLCDEIAVTRSLAVRIAMYVQVAVSYTLFALSVAYF